MAILNHTYIHTVIPRFTSQLVTKNGDINRNDVNRISYCLYYKVVSFQQGT